MSIPEAVQQAIDKQLGKEADDNDEASEEEVAVQPEKPKGEFIEPPLPPTDAKRKCIAEIGKILTEHGGFESNIPHNHRYWDLVNLNRSL